MFTKKKCGHNVRFADHKEFVASVATLVPTGQNSSAEHGIGDLHVF
jgi:hypothetical protein